MTFVNHKLISEALSEFRANRKLQYGLLGIALILCVEGGMRWVENLSSQEKQLQQLRSELRQLRSQSRDEDDLRQQLADLERAQQTIDERLWVVSSEAVGQAQLKDWLSGVLKKAEAKKFKLVLSSPRPVSKAGAVRGGRAGGKGESSAQQASDLRDFRANVTMEFSPVSLERVLRDIEGGLPLAMVESLMVKRQERKVDLSVRVMMRIGETSSPMLPGAGNPAGSIEGKQ